MKQKSIETELTIIGAGPAGLSASLFLSKKKISHVLIDKSAFPRDKICGDALSGKVTSILRDLDPALPEKLSLQPDHYMPSWGVVFSAPDGNAVAVPFKHKPEKNSIAPGFIARRTDFDHFLVRQIDENYCTFLQNEKVKDVSISDSGCIVITELREINSKIVLGADGSRNLLGKKFLNYHLDPSSYCAGLRQYYKGIKGLSTEGYIELHFVKEALPGYFWIFPLPNGEANVGIGMLSKYISREKVDMKILLKQVIESTAFAERFDAAEATDKVRGWGLPLGGKRIPLSSDRMLVLGDAASLIDPFTGEGIGNAMISGRIAATVCEKALLSNNYRAAYMAEFDKLVYAKLSGELRLSKILQRLIRYPWLFNWIIRKVKRNEELRRTITFMFEDVNLRRQFLKPSFYFRLLFK